MRCCLWLSRRRAVIGSVIAHLGTYASLIGVLLQLSPSWDELSLWIKALIVLSTVATLWLIAKDIQEAMAKKVFRKYDNAGIGNYLEDWIEHGGRVAIWTRDMSWAHEKKTKKLLIDKASRSELILCMPNCSELSDKLQEHGAEVCIYGESGFQTPNSRFTITCFGRDGARVAVGRAQGAFHVIEEFDSAKHPAFHLANDLVNLARNLKQEGSENATG